MAIVRGEITGDYAHDAADSLTGSFPMKIGGVAKEHDGTDPGSVAEDDRVHAIFNRQGIQYVQQSNPFSFHTTVAYAGATTNSALIAAPGANVSLYITDILFSSDTICTFTFVEDTASAVTKHKAFTNSNDYTPTHFINPIKLTANKNFGVTTSATNTAITICGFKGP